MKLGRLLLTVLTAGLGLSTAMLLERVAGHSSSVRTELSRVKLSTLEPALESKLGQLHDTLSITYYVTREDKMPSNMRHVEREVVDLLRALAANRKGKVEWWIVDPTDDDDLKKFAANRKVAPVRMRSVAHDQYSEQEVWSTLSITYGPKPPALIEGIGQEHLPRLQHILLEQLNQLEAPRKPVFALAAPSEGTRLLHDDLARRGELREVDLEHGQAIPQDADVLFIVKPRTVDATTLRRLRHFQETGGSIVVVGSLHDAKIDPTLLSCEVEPGSEAIDILLKEFGVRVVPGLLLDRKSATQSLPTGEPGSIFRVGCLTLNQDFQSLARDPRGTILASAANALQLDSTRLEELGMRAEVLATSSDDSAIFPFATKQKLDAGTMLTAGDPVPKQPILVWARPNEPWKGSVVAASFPSLVDDSVYGVEQIANQRTVETLLETIASQDRLVMRRAGVVKPPPLPELSAGSRVLWRTIVVLLFPATLLLLGLFRRRRDERIESERATSRRGTARLAMRVVGGFVAVAASVALVRVVAARTPLRIDLTAHGTNALAAASSKIAGETKESVRVELCFSDDSRLPPEMKSLAASLRETLREFESAGADLTIVPRPPEDLDATAQGELASLGVKPVRATSRIEEVTTVRNYYASVVLRGYSRAIALAFDDVESFENLEFRIAFGLWRLRTGKQAILGFASDVPRLSAGEAWQFYQQRGLIPPSGKDVYSLAREILEKNDFKVVHINPRSPTLPADLDALLWLQPRRSVTEMLPKFTEYLYKGGRAMVAAQHFSMQARQYRGRDLDFVYWPQPQSPDVEEFYYPDLGVMMVREVLFDKNDFPIELDTQLHRSGRREFESQDLAKPFCIRASSARFDKSSWITKTLSDQPFVFGAFFDLDAAKLAAAGLKATTLMRTSDESWTFLWSGGWLPHGMLTGPGATPKSTERDKDVVPEKYRGSLPMAVLLEGQFPWPKSEFVFPPQTIGADGKPIDQPPRPPFAAPEPAKDKKPGRLVMVGNSEMFKDTYLLQLRPTFRADQFLLNAATDLALGDDLASVMAHRVEKHGFERVPSESILAWRAKVVMGAPLVILVLAVLRAIFEALFAASRARAMRGAL